MKQGRDVVSGGHAVEACEEENGVVAEVGEGALSSVAGDEMAEGDY